MRWLVLLLAVLQAFPVSAAVPWRFWTKADGLPESIVFGLTTGSGGRIVAKFGAVPSLSALDGYRITDVPAPHVYGRFLTSPQDELWTFDTEGIEIHDASGWHKYPDPEIAAFAKASPMLRTPWFMYSVYRGPEDRMDIVPIGNGSGIIMFPNVLVEWNRLTGQKRVVRRASETGLVRFRDIQMSSDGGLWITGASGLAHLKRRGAEYAWSEHPAPPARTDLVSPNESRPGEVFTSALRPDGRRVLLSFADDAWKELYVGSSGALKGWRGPEGSIWVQNERKIIEVESPASGDAGDGRMITGLTTAVVAPTDQGFWLGTTEGIARYSPPLWRTPPEAAWADTVVSAIAEDQQDRMWFLSGQYLLVDDRGTWRRFQLPSGAREALLTDNIIVLENGDLAMRGNALADLIVFSPRSGKSKVMQHPEGKRIGTVGKRRDGGAWVQVFDDGFRWHLEVFDGSHFRRGSTVDFTSLKDLKVILEARNGDIWLGSADSLGLIRAGKAKIIGVKDGFGDSAVFSAVESSAGKIILGGRDGVSEYEGKSFRKVQNIDTAETMSLSGDGVLWIGSGSGIHRYRAGQTITNTIEDGLPATAVRKSYIDRKGRVWIGTSHGISLYYPEADPDPPLTKIIDDQNLRETPPGGEVRLAFSGADKWKFTSPDRLTFSWRMDGSVWSDFSASQFAGFKGLHSGPHRFEVRAMDRNGNIDPTPASYAFSVLLPWYRQKEFLIFAVIAMCIIVCLSRMALRHHRRLAYQSRHDPLTGLANRAVFDVNFQHAIAAARAEDSRLAVILLDLDRFKAINDTLGHVVGDLFLREVSKRLKRSIRKQDTLARLGGDEFAIIMPGIGARLEAESMARNILESLRQPYKIDSFELAGSASIGVSLFPEHGDDTATLHRLADMAMYQCKAQNKNQYAVFDAEVNRLDFRSAEMAGLIREALAKDYFHVHYQPLTARDGELVGFEALIRLEHPRFGSIPPSDFISIAEETGLIASVGDWVLRQACREMAQWHASGNRRLRLNVNVSTVQLKNPDFARTVRSIVEETSLNPCALTLEITETAMMHSWAESASQIEQLRTSGIRIALDDFGTGYSTLNSLHVLPVDYIKIDRSFIQRLGEEAGSGLIVVQAIAQLVHKFGFEVVAEGVELPEQLAGLKFAGCDFFQGYLLGKPMPGEDVQRLLDSKRAIAESVCHEALIPTCT